MTHLGSEIFLVTYLVSEIYLTSFWIVLHEEMDQFCYYPTFDSNYHYFCGPIDGKLLMTFWLLCKDAMFKEKKKKKTQIDWRLFVFILWHLYVFFLHSMESFGCVDCCMKNNQGGWMIFGCVNCRMNNDQEGWTILMLMLSLFTTLLAWISNLKKWRLAIWYHYFTHMGSNIGKHILFVALSIITIIFTFNGSNIAIQWITIFHYCMTHFKERWVIMISIFFRC